MTCGIYLLRFKNTDKVYVGQSKDIEDRFNKHICLLRNNRAAIKLQEAHTTYGLPYLNVLIECNEESLNDYENHFINMLNSVENGFNTVSMAGARPVLFGDSNPNTKYPDNKVKEAIELLTLGIPYKEISDRTNIPVKILYNIKNKTTRTDLTKDIEFPDVNRGNIKELEEILDMLIEFPIASFKELSIALEKDAQLIRAISAGVSHVYLKEKLPEKYSKATQLHSTRVQNKKYPYKGSLVSPKGEVIEIYNMSEFARENNLDLGATSRLLAGYKKQYKGWKLAPSA